MKPNSEILLCQMYQLGPDKWNYVDIGYTHINSKNELILLQKDTSQEVIVVPIKQENEFCFDQEEAIQFHCVQDYALSFQSREGAMGVWTRIQNILVENEAEDQDSIALTPVSETNLETILDTMNNMIAYGSQSKQMLLSYLINKKEYFDKLIKLFQQLEKDNNTNLLQTMCQIVKNIVTVAEHELFQIILNDQNYLFIFGALEYDTEMNKKNFVPHRQYLEKHAPNQEQRATQNHSFHISAAVLARLWFGLLHRRVPVDVHKDSFNSCYVDLFKYIENSKDFLIEVIDKLRNFNFLALRFLCEICSVFKEFPDLNKVVIYQKLSEYGLYEIIEDYINDSLKGFEKYKAKLKKLKLKISDDVFTKIPNMILELLIVCLQHCPNYFRQYVISEHQQVLKYPFFNIIVENAFQNELYMEALKLMIDNNSEEQNETMDLFLLQFYPKITAQISHTATKEFKQQFLEITLGLVRAMKPQVKEAVILNQVALKVGFVLQENQKLLQTKCLQIIKLICLSRDDDINNEITMIIPNLISVILAYKGLRENLIFSQQLEIIKIIYEGISQKLITSLEDELKRRENQPNYQRIHEIFKNLKNNCMKQQFSSQPQQQSQMQSRYNVVVDDEMDLFISVQGHSSPHLVKQQKKTQDHEEEVDLITKKIKID
ncbi:unnamed protein product (macronuclear) [Paramecium tetraurelia]|uniref:Serine/threonine-protein phosphatase 4 regulatory subunit 3-like central domain-containing protein n=1 Tax=Paramecium tetraurelia TaxID=5888 RepID=A0D4Q0_PARTE|nr:uncharacterized protein GSPATT00013464001 [Paramecium tetraurelia]CAK78017.1 unnamed protein product [Paramecium tetraurelia]|eukprot:XP_001445414.1 hypothetical protein (macronuclear) [Paramecium tetraurelia strain d4-2]